MKVYQTGAKPSLGGVNDPLVPALIDRFYADPVHSKHIHDPASLLL